MELVSLTATLEVVNSLYSLQKIKRWEQELIMFLSDRNLLSVYEAKKCLNEFLVMVFLFEI